MFSSKLLIFALAAFVAIVSSATTPPCIKNIDGEVFNLCPLDTPILFTSENGKPPSKNITFGLAKPNVEPCKRINDTRPANKTVWMTVIDKNGRCIEYDNEPTYKFYFVRGYPAISISYSNSILFSNPIELRIVCDEEASPSAPPTEVKYAFSEGHIFVSWSTTSYYGCPIKTQHK